MEVRNACRDKIVVTGDYATIKVVSHFCILGW